MTLPSSRLGQARIEYNGAHLVLNPSITNLERIEAKYDMPHASVFRAMMVDKLIMSNVFEILQTGTSYTKDEIDEWLFGDVAAISTEENAKMFAKAFAILAGVKYEAMLAEVEEKLADDTKKKPLRSTSPEQ